jgi:hypothetical protein
MLIRAMQAKYVIHLQEGALMHGLGLRLTQANHSTSYEGVHSSYSVGPKHLVNWRTSKQAVQFCVATQEDT